MVFDKKPETELEYWQAICAAEKEVMRIADGFRRGLIPKGERTKLKQEQEAANDTLDALYISVETKFGVWARKRHPEITIKGLPEDKRDFLVWWNDMDALASIELAVVKK